MPSPIPGFTTAGTAVEELVTAQSEPCADAQERSPIGSSPDPKERPILFSGPMVCAILDGRKTQTRRVVKGVPSWDHYGRDIMDWGLSGIHQETYDPHNPIDGTDRWHLDVQTDVDDLSRRVIRCPYGAPGDRLWVREACRAEELSRPPQSRPATRRERRQLGRTTVIELSEFDGRDGVRYRADNAWGCIENTPAAADAWSELYHYRGRGKAGIGNWVASFRMPRWASRITLEITGVRVERLQDISEADALAEGVEPPTTERDEHDWSICPKCGGTGLHGALGEHLGYYEVYCSDCDTAAKRFHHLWESINGADQAKSWAANPWVWVVEFQRAQPSADAGGH